MFKKLLKYDMKSVWRLWWIAAMVVPIAAVVGAMMLRFVITATSKETDVVTDLLIIAAILLVFICLLAIVLSFVLTMVLVYVRFYKNLYTDEGYLTFTLPVTRRQILLSKTVNAVIWYTLHGLLIMGSLAIFCLLFLPPERGGSMINTEMFEAVGVLWTGLWELFGGWMLLYGLELVVLLLVGTLQGIALFHLCITVGSIIAKKAKVVAAIGIYYAANSALSIMLQTLFSCFTLFIAPELTTIKESLAENEACLVIALAILVLIAITGIIATAFYNLTQHLLDRKLNLA